nr:hypothetical protein CFP56_57567 [Quercus suber]
MFERWDIASVTAQPHRPWIAWRPPCTVASLLYRVEQRSIKCPEVANPDCFCTPESQSLRAPLFGDLMLEPSAPDRDHWQTLFHESTDMKGSRQKNFDAGGDCTLDSTSLLSRTYYAEGSGVHSDLCHLRLGTSGRTTCVTLFSNGSIADLKCEEQGRALQSPTIVSKFVR